MFREVRVQRSAGHQGLICEVAEEAKHFSGEREERTQAASVTHKDSTVQEGQKEWQHLRRSRWTSVHLPMIMYIYQITR